MDTPTLLNGISSSRRSPVGFVIEYIFTALAEMALIAHGQDVHPADTEAKDEVDHHLNPIVFLAPHFEHSATTLVWWAFIAFLCLAIDS
jgi:hypothetical protein